VERSLELALPALPDETTLTALLAGTVRTHGDKVALRIQRDRAWTEVTYGTLFEQSQRLAADLVASGYSPGSRAILYAESQPEWVIAYFGCTAAGMTVVPLDPQTPFDEVHAIARFTDARLIFHSQAVLANAPSAMGTDPTFDLPDVRRVEDLAGQLPPRVSDKTTDLGTPSESASIIFTAGTTVDPKGVVLTHRNFVANMQSVSAVLEPFETDEFLSILPLNHAFEFTNGLLIPIATGATVTYSGSLKPRNIVDTLQRIQATVMLGMPRVYQMLYETVRRRTQNGDGDLRSDLRMLFGDSIRVLVSGGAALDPDVYTAFVEAGIPIHEGYGLTETAPVLTVNPLHQTRKGSVGMPLPGVDLRIESPDSDGIGEIVVRGSNVMAGYFRNETATAKVLRDGWLYTGDLGYLDERGYLHITGRSKDVIVTSAGKNVYPDEVELLYKSVPHVREMCVVGIKDAQRREEVHGVFVLSRGDARDASVRQEIHASLADIGGRIPSYQRIQHVHFWEHELPKTHQMTVKREDVRSLLSAGEVPSDPTEVPPSETARTWEQGSWEAQLVGEIARIAGVDSTAIQPGHDFDRDLNLDSLMKVELLAMLESNLQILLPDHIALKFQTVQDVMDYIAPHMGETRGPEPAFQRQAVTLGALPSKEYESQYLVKSRLQNLLAGLFRFGAGVMYRSLFHLRTTGVENLPKSGPFIIAANHCSHLDSAAILTTLRRRAKDTHVLGAKDYFFDSYVKGWLVSTFLNVLPFDRYGDFVRSLGLSQRAVEMGRSLLIFPEGTRSRTGEIQPFKPGLGLLALELGVPIVPAYIDGTYQALPKGQFLPQLAPVRVHLGEPITVEPYIARREREPHYPLYREITCRVQEKVADLRAAASSHS